MDGPVPTLGMAPRLSVGAGVRLLSYLALLPATAAELDATVTRAVADNPFLQRRPWRTCPGCGLATAAPRCPACATPAWEVEPAAPDDWRADLLSDARAELPRHRHPAAEAVVAALDDHGLLRVEPDLEPTDLAEVVTTLRLVGPPGIAATSPTDCVRVQARALVDAGEADPVLAALADDWLPALAEGLYDEIAAALGVPEQAVRDAAAVLRARVRPFVALAGGGPRSAPTDVVFVRERTGPDGSATRVVAHVADAAGLGLGRVTDELPRSPEARAWAAPHRDAADRLLAAVAARSRMLHRVATCLAERQEGFVLGGPDAHRPLRRADVASALGVHPATVGRTVAGKVARCPDGRTVELAAFFGAGTSIRTRVAAAVLEHPGATDAELAAALARTGPPLARRTVAKYRALVANRPSPSD